MVEAVVLHQTIALVAHNIQALHANSCRFQKLTVMALQQATTEFVQVMVPALEIIIACASMGLVVFNVMPLLVSILQHPTHCEFVLEEDNALD